MLEWIGLLVFGAIFLLVAFKGFSIVRPTERGVIERFGKFFTVVDAGLVLLIPLVDDLIRINVTEQMVDAEQQEVITKDSLNAMVDAQVYFRVKSNPDDVKRSQYEVNNYYRQIVQLSKTTLRDIMGNMHLMEANSKRNTINDQLAAELRKQTSGWGLEIIRTEIKEIEPPDDVQKQMNRVVVAEKEKEAAHDFATATETKADGDRRAAIKSAEGERKALILRAEGQATAICTVADARAQEIKVVNESARKHFKEEAQDLAKIEAAKIALKDNAKFVVPQGSDLVNVIGDSVGVLPIRKKK